MNQPLVASSALQTAGGPSRVLIRNILLAVISGALTGLSFYSPSFSWLVWFSLTPFIYLCGQSKAKSGFWPAYIFGFFYFFTSIFWVSKVTYLGLAVLLVYLSFYPALFYFGARFFLKRPLSLISLPCLWVVLEFIREHLFTGFGWASLGYSQYRLINFIQAADVLGVKLISFIIIAVNVFFFEALSRKSFLFRKTIIIFCLISASFIYSHFRLLSFPQAETLKATVIQPNISQKLKWEESARDDIVDSLAEFLSRSPSDALAILPESAWPYIIDNITDSDFQGFFKALKRDTLIGAVREERGSFYNSVYLLLKDGSLQGSYDKINLVPFGEYVPFRNYFRFISVLNDLGDISPGRNLKVFNYHEKKFAVLICFEDLFPLFVSRMSRPLDFMVNITNDGWFNGAPQASQHLSVMVFRAIENRISILRCANTGISGLVNFKGEADILKDKNKDTFFAAEKLYKIPLNKKRSIYNKLGEVLPLISFIFLAVIYIKDRMTGIANEDRSSEN